MVGLPLTPEAALALRILTWKFRHPGISAAAIEDLKKTVFPTLPSWYKIVMQAAKLAPNVEAREFPCCVRSCYASTSDPPEQSCPHCLEPLFTKGKPRKVFPWFPLAGRLARQWLSADRAELLCYRTNDDGARLPMIDYIQGSAYQTIEAGAEGDPLTDKHTHFLAISLDGFQVFKAYVATLSSVHSCH